MASDWQQKGTALPSLCRAWGAAPRAHARLLPLGPPSPDPNGFHSLQPRHRGGPCLHSPVTRIDSSIVPPWPKPRPAGRSGEDSREVARDQPGQELQRTTEKEVRRSGWKVHWRFHLASALRTRLGDVSAPPLLGDAPAFCAHPAPPNVLAAGGAPVTETLLAGREANYNSQRAQPPWASPPRLRCLDKGTLGFEFDSSGKKSLWGSKGP